MSNPFESNNPGLGGLNELTQSEELFIQNLSGLAYASGDILYYNGANLTRLPKGTDGEFLSLASGIPDWVTSPAGYTNLTQFVGQTAWRVFYSDASGDVQELALGADGTFLKSNGASVAPTFATPAGSGDVSKVGTPVNNQVGVWTGDGTIEGDVDLTFDTTTNTLGVGLIGLDGRVQVHAVKSDASDGLLIEASDGTDVGLLGVGNTANVSWSGAHNFATATQDTIAGFTGAGKTLGSLSTSTYPSLTELSYVKGLTSAVQTQINAKQSTITFGTGVQTALGVNIGSAGAPVLFNGALGTPTSGTVTNLTGTASININGTVGATTPAAGTFTAAIANSFVPNLSTVPSNGMYLPAGNTLGWAINSAAELQLTSTAFSPAADGGQSLGTTTLGWQNLFGNTGFVWNIENGNWVATHTTGILTVGTGDLRVTTAGTNTASVVTVGGSQILTGKTLTSPTITTANLSGAQLLEENASIALDPSLSADGKWAGITMTATAGYTQAFGDLVYLAVADSRWELADADASATAGPVALAMVVVAGTDGASCTLLLQGVIRADAKFPTMTVGATQYVGETAGAIQGTIPTGADNIIRTVGYALTADALYFNPSTDWQVTVA
jgi:hypothetical protein